VPSSCFPRFFSLALPCLPARPPDHRHALAFRNANGRHRQVFGAGAGVQRQNRIAALLQPTLVWHRYRLCAPLPPALLGVSGRAGAGWADGMGCPLPHLRRYRGGVGLGLYQLIHIHLRSCPRLFADGDRSHQSPPQVRRLGGCSSSLPTASLLSALDDDDALRSAHQDGDGVLASGGATCNFMGLLCARDKLFPESKTVLTPASPLHPTPASSHGPALPFFLYRLAILRGRSWSASHLRTATTPSSAARG